MAASNSRRMGLAASTLAMIFTSGCGGGGGGVGSTPIAVAPTPTPTPAPTPTPTAPTAASFQTPEYTRSDGPLEHNAIAAWLRGATGQGITIGIIDSGVDPTNPEFAGRISPSSTDVAGNRVGIPEDDHGTQVALVAAAARNNSGVLGIAYDATILSMRTDTPGTCTLPDGCDFAGSAIAAGIDRSVAAGAKVVNISLGGGSTPGFALRSAVARAAAAGVLIVVSAGNREDSDTAAMMANPDPFAIGLRQAGNGNVIIVGSVNNSGVISDFSYRAGTEALWYITAVGERVCCVYENGAIRITVNNGVSTQTVVSGTSFSAPQVAGAAALLFQAFPNLTANQVADLLLSTARSGGGLGTNQIYGRGMLDISNAFAAQGTMSVASTQEALPLGETTAITSAAMGDAAANPRIAGLSAIMLDRYQRAYTVNLGQRMQAAPATPGLAGALLSPSRQWSAGANSSPVSAAFSVGQAGSLAEGNPLRLTSSDAQMASVLAGRIAAQIAPNSKVAFGFAQGADGLVAQMQGKPDAAFLIASSPADDFGFGATGKLSFAARQQIAGWGITLAADRGDVQHHTSDLRNHWDLLDRREDQITRFGITADRQWDTVSASLGAHWLAEDRTLLGARFHDGFGKGGADSLFLDARAGWNVSPRLHLGAAWRQGFTHARRGGLIAAGSTLGSNGWSVDLTRRALLARDDALAFRLSQPLRVASGGINLDLPVAWDYASLSATNQITRFGLIPSGRQLDAELAWRGWLGGGVGSASLFLRKQPGHIAALPDEKGVALRWERKF